MDIKIEKGSFLSLKTIGSIEPADVEKYNNLTSGLFKSEAIVILFATFWARVFEVSNFTKLDKKSSTKRGIYYGLFVVIPSVFNSFFLGNRYIKEINKLDAKYTNLYLEHVKSKIKQSN